MTPTGKLKLMGYMDRARPYMYGIVIGMLGEYLYRVGYNFWPVFILAFMCLVFVFDVFFDIFTK